MRIFVTGTAERISEFSHVIDKSEQLSTVVYDEAFNYELKDFDLVVDLNLDEQPERVKLYNSLPGNIVLAGAVKRTLKEIAAYAGTLHCRLVGFNSIPTFINRGEKEVSFLDDHSRNAFALLADALGWKWQEVKDSAGMVSIRTIAMIINEACFTLQEGTASKEDIDKGMKLGTAYPLGPLEWADRIGIQHVFETLKAIQKEKGDKRHQISPLLKEMYDRKEKFYN